jgi:hypothetical protein
MEDKENCKASPIILIFGILFLIDISALICLILIKVLK